MEKTVLTRVKEAEDFIKAGDASNKEEYLKYLARWISYIQHERFVHLVVTMFFGLFAMLCILVFFINFNFAVLGALFIFVVTLGFYVRHYFILENKTQYLYDLYDRIEKM